MATQAKERSNVAVFLDNVKKIRQEEWGDVSGYLFVASLFIMWLIFGGYPYIRGLLITFQDYRVFDRASWSFFNSFVGLRNFIEIFSDEYAWSGIKAAFYLYLSWFPASFVLSLGTAIVLNRVKQGKVSATYRILMTLPWVIPMAASMPMWEQIYEPNFGYLNHFLRNVLAIWPRPPAWVSDRFWYWPAIGVAAIWKGFGYYMLLFLIGLFNIPKEHYEVAILDGANWWQKLWYLELPSIRNILLLFFVTNAGFLGAGTVEMLTFGQGPANIGKTIALRGYEAAFTGSMRLGYGSAINFTIGLMNLFFVALIFRFFKSEKA
jgi:multiple sugar transport system permease protein